MSDAHPGAAPERWVELRIKPSNDELLAEAAALLIDAGFRAVEERAGVLIAHQPWPDEPNAAAADIQQRLETRLGCAVALEWASIKHADWTELWKQGLSIRRIGRRVVVKPSWIPYTGRSEEVIVEIDPGMAFGTAEHATTRGCLELLDRVVAPGDRVLDVGTGSAILSIAASGLGAQECLALDVDPLAVDAALRNVERNRASGIRVELMDVDPGSDPEDLFDVVVANMIMGLVLPRMAYLAGSTKRNGTLVIGGAQLHEREAVVRAAAAAGFWPIHEHTEEGWWSGAFRRSGSSYRSDTPSSIDA